MLPIQAIDEKERQVEFKALQKDFARLVEEHNQKIIDSGSAEPLLSYPSLEVGYGKTRKERNATSDYYPLRDFMFNSSQAHAIFNRVIELYAPEINLHAGVAKNRYRHLSFPEDEFIDIAIMGTPSDDIKISSANGVAGAFLKFSPEDSRDFSHFLNPTLKRAITDYAKYMGRAKRRHHHNNHEIDIADDKRSEYEDPSPVANPAREAIMHEELDNLIKASKEYGLLGKHSPLSEGLQRFVRFIEAHNEQHHAYPTSEQFKAAGYSFPDKYMSRVREQIKFSSINRLVKESELPTILLANVTSIEPSGQVEQERKA